MPDTSYYYPRFYLGLSEGEKREPGEIPSCDMCFDGRYYAVSGFITGAIGAKFPGMNHLVEGVVDTTVSAGERLAYAVFDDSMSWDEKWAYAFDPGQMVADFVTGVVIGEILDGIMAATQNKLRSIFANNDAAMREALGSGKKTVVVNGKTVTMDNSIFDPNFVDRQGRTNIQRMEQGLAPIGTDGKSINIHHIDQTNNGPVMEIMATEHQQNYRKLHTNIGQAPSQINRSEFNSWRRGYWEWRSHNLD